MTDDERRELAELRATLDALRTQVQAAEARLRALEGPGPAAAAPTPSPPLAAAAPLPTRPARRPRARPIGLGAPRPPREPSPAERYVRAFLAEVNPLSLFGALMLLVGAAILFKYAIDNNWIGPTGRVAMGILAGMGFLAAGEYFQHQAETRWSGWRRFAPVLVGAGQGILFIAVYFGQQQYEIIPAPLAFGLYLVFTATVVAQSLRYNAVALAMWGLVGGYLTPALASTGSGNYVFLSTYLLVLNTGVFAVAYHRTWQPLKWMAFLLTVPYMFLWVANYLADPHGTRWLEFHWLLPYLWVFFVYFAAIPTWRSVLRREPIDRFGQVLTILNGVVHFAFAVALLYEDHRIWLGVVAVVVSALYVVISSRVVRQPELDQRALVVFAGTAGAFLMLATPFLARGSAITLVWCAETVFLAWVCTQPRYGFLRYHVLVMLAIILIRLIARDQLLSPAWSGVDKSYIPLFHLRSYPPLAAAATFALVARLLARVPNLRLPLGWVLAPGLIVLVAAMDGEAYRVARYVLVPGTHLYLRELVQAGLLVGVLAAMWFAAMRILGASRIPWIALFGFTALLTFWVLDDLLWPVPYRRMVRVLDPDMGLWWLHGGVLFMLPLVVLFARLVAHVPDGLGKLSRDQVRALCFAAAVVVTMLLMRREIFAITHAPPLADLFPDAARRSWYRMLLSLSYAALAFGIYLSAIRTDLRLRLYAAYSLYVFIALKVMVLDIESRNQLYRGFSVVAMGLVLILSHYFAQRQRMRHAQ